MGNEPMIRLRSLRESDAPKMLEWMHDVGVCGLLEQDFSTKTMEDCLTFIQQAERGRETQLHLAVSNQEGAYLGTVSLKNIDRKNQNAEFAIVLTKDAIGQGAAGEAVKSILRIGFEEYKLYKIYLYVSKANERAVRFYQKSVFSFEAEFKNHIVDGTGVHRDLLWFSVTRDEWKAKEET